MLTLKTEGNVEEEIYSSFLRDIKFKDLKIVCSDGPTYAHRVVLARVSGILRHQLQDPLRDTILLPDFEKSFVDSVLNLIYGIEGVTVEKATAKKLLRLLGVHGYSLQETPKSGPKSSGGQERRERHRQSVASNSDYNVKTEPASQPNPGIDAGGSENARSAAREESVSDVTSTALEQMDEDEAATDSSRMVAGNSAPKLKKQPVKKRLANKMKVPTPTKTYRCGFCSKTFPSLGFRNGHIRKIHPDNRPAKCPNCGVDCTKGDIRKHVLLHHGKVASEKVPYYCQICPDTFTKAHQIAVHYRTCHKRRWLQCKPSSVNKRKVPIRTELICNFCDRKFLYKIALQKHLQKTHRVVEDEAIPVGCTSCKESFPSLKHLKAHDCPRRKAAASLSTVPQHPNGPSTCPHSDDGQFTLPQHSKEPSTSFQHHETMTTSPQHHDRPPTFHKDLNRPPMSSQPVNGPPMSPNKQVQPTIQDYYKTSPKRPQNPNRPPNIPQFSSGRPTITQHPVEQSSIPLPLISHQHPAGQSAIPQPSTSHQHLAGQFAIPQPSTSHQHPIGQSTIPQNPTGQSTVAQPSTSRQHPDAPLTTPQYPQASSGGPVRTSRKNIEKRADYQPIPDGKCLVCETLLADKNEYLMHFKSVHGGKGEHVCDICGKKFSKRINCASHHALHNPVQKCEFCWKEFSSKRQLTIHQNNACAPKGLLTFVANATDSQMARYTT